MREGRGMALTVAEGRVLRSFVNRVCLCVCVCVEVSVYYRYTRGYKMFLYVTDVYMCIDVPVCCRCMCV